MTLDAAAADARRPFRARCADVAGWEHAEAVGRFARQVAAEELLAAALDVDNETVAGILRDRAAELTA